MFLDKCNVFFESRVEHLSNLNLIFYTSFASASVGNMPVQLVYVHGTGFMFCRKVMQYTMVINDIFHTVVYELCFCAKVRQDKQYDTNVDACTV